MKIRKDGRLEMGWSELCDLQSFLESVGVRCRYSMFYTDKTLNERVYVVEAENPYKAWIGKAEKKTADALMSPGAISRYQE